MNTFDDDTMLTERLHRLGATAPVPHVDPLEDVRRGRRRARRARLITTAGTVLAVGIIAIGGVALRPLVTDRAADPAGSPGVTSTASASEAKSVAQVLPSSFDLAFHLINERHNASAGVPNIVMRPTQATTDEVIATWTTEAEKIDVDRDPDLAAAASGIQRSLDTLPQTRSEMRTQATRDRAWAAYTTLANDLVAIATLVPSVGDAEVDAKVEALGHLRPALESFDTERTIMVRALAKRQIALSSGGPSEVILSKNELAELDAADATWRRSLEEMYTATSKDQRETLDQIIDGTATEGVSGLPPQQLVNAVLSGNTDRATTSPDQYTAYAVNVIRGLHQLSIASADEVVKDLAALD